MSRGILWAGMGGVFACGLTACTSPNRDFGLGTSEGGSAGASTDFGGSAATQGTSGAGADSGRGGSAGAQGTAGAFCVEGDCTPCDPGTSRCSPTGSVPQLCSDAGEWVNRDACTSPLATCLGGACVSCSPGIRRCNDNTVEECRDDGSGWDVLEVCTGDTPACLESTTTCGRCSEGDKQCNGDVVQTCDAGSWQAAQTCSGSTPQCFGGECTECDPAANERRCQNGASVQTCNADGTWGTATPCTGDTPVCRVDLGFACGCQEGERRCRSATVPELCDGGGWVPQTGCSGNTPECLPSTGQCVGCVGGTRSCGDCGLGTETCTNNVWSSCVGAVDLETDEAHCGTCANACGARETCLSGGCTCSSGNHACGGTTTPCYVDTDADHCGTDCFDCSLFHGTTGTCSGGACACNGGTSLACLSDAPSCGFWDFESGTLEGWSFGTYRNDESAATGSPTVRQWNGSRMLAVDYSGTGAITLQVQLCPDGSSISLASHTLSWDTYLTTRQGSGLEAGGIPLGNNYTITSCQPINIPSDQLYSHSCPLAISTGSTVLQLYITLPPNEFGTLYIDNVRLTPP